MYSDGFLAGVLVPILSWEVAHIGDRREPLQRSPLWSDVGLSIPDCQKRPSRAHRWLSMISFGYRTRQSQIADLIVDAQTLNVALHGGPLAGEWWTISYNLTETTR